jgi:predicted DNA-binding transcriptional regulator
MHASELLLVMLLLCCALLLPAILDRHADIRAATFAKVLAVSEAYVRESKALLLRASLLKHDMVQRSSGAGGGGE